MLCRSIYGNRLKSVKLNNEWDIRVNRGEFIGKYNMTQDLTSFQLSLELVPTHC